MQLVPSNNRKLSLNIAASTPFNVIVYIGTALYTVRALLNTFLQVQFIVYFKVIYRFIYGFDRYSEYKFSLLHNLVLNKIKKT